MSAIKVPLLRLPYTQREIDEIKDDIEAVLKSGYLTMASKVQEFEKRFAGFCGTRHAIGTNSGTSALEIILRAIDVSDGTVVMPSNTYMATPLAAIKAGAAVIFTDCQKDNMQMDPEDLSKKIREDTKAVIIVHIGGIISPEIEKIQDICKSRQIPLVEDAAHAHGAEYLLKKAGRFGVAAAFSFYPTKVLTTAEGGMIVTDSDSILKKSIILREHGKKDHAFNVHVEIGDNWRFSELHAVLGIQQMKKAADILAERRRIARRYDELLTDIDWLRGLTIPDSIRSSYYKYIAFLKGDLDRDRVKQALVDKRGVQLTGEVYASPCHSQPMFDKYPQACSNERADRFPNTDFVCQRHICLPLYPGLQDEEIEYVAQSLRTLEF